MLLNNSQIAILENLAVFKFLTKTQMAKLGIRKKASYLHRAITPIRDNKKPLISRVVMGALVPYGKLEDVYFLTKNGVLMLEDNALMDKKEIRYPKSKFSLFHRDYKHRLAAIDFHIALKLWLDSIEGRIKIASSYFDKPGSQRRGEPLILNKIEIDEDNYIIPDMIILLNDNQKDYLFAFEQENGKDTGGTIKKIIKYLPLIERGLISEKVGIDRASRICVVFEHQSILEATTTRLNEMEDMQPYKPFFIFKPQNELDNDFANNWCFWDKSKTSFIGG